MSSPAGATNRLPRLAGSSRSCDAADPIAQVRMSRRPCQHGEGNAEIIVPLQALVDRSSVALLDFKIGQLFKRASHHRTIDEADQIGLQFGMEKFEEISAADGVDQHRTVFDRASFGIHAIAVAGNVQANHAHPERLEQHLGVSRIIAQP